MVQTLFTHLTLQGRTQDNGSKIRKLDENNIVIGEILLDDSACGSSEAEAVANLQKMYGWQFWKRTYYGTEEGEAVQEKTMLH